MDEIILLTTLTTIGLLVGIGYYLSRLRNMIDNVGYMVATMMDHFDIPEQECDGCENCETTFDVRRNDTLLNQHPRYGWQSWDGEQE